MKIITILFLSLLTSCLKPSSNKFIVSIKKETLNTMPPHFLSFAIDMAQITGGKWWEGSSDFSMGRGGAVSPKLNFNRDRLVSLTAALAPSVIRAGGSEADSLYYSLDDSEEIPQGFQTTLSKNTWSNFYSFVKKTDNIPLLTLNIGPGYRDENGELTYKHFHKLFSFLISSEHSMEFFELGNEINAFFLNYGLQHQIDAKTYSSEYLKVKQILRSYFPESRLLGPANAFWPFIGEVFTNISVSSEDIIGELGNELDVFSWHFYPSQSHRCPVNVNRATEYAMTEPSTVKSISNIANTVNTLSKPYEFESWLGETGPAQCGGEPEVSTSFSSTLWWIDFVGKISRTKNKVMIRQTLVGSDYGIIDNNSLSIRHDYVSSYIFKSMKNRRTLRIKSEYDNIYAYCDDSNILNILMVNFKKHSVEIQLKNLNDQFSSFYIDEKRSRDLLDIVNSNNYFTSSIIDKFISNISMNSKNEYVMPKRSYVVAQSLAPSQFCKSH